MYEKIDNLCKQKGITVNQLENELGFSQGTISHWKKSMPRADKICLVARYLGVPTEYLIINEEDIVFYDTEALIKKGIGNVVALSAEQEKPSPSGGDGMSEARLAMMAELDGMTEDEIWDIIESVKAAKAIIANSKKRKSPAKNGEAE